MVSIDSWWDSRVRDRAQAVLELVITAIADDYENLETIQRSINGWREESESGSWWAKDAIPVSRREVVKALTELTREGYAQTFLALVEDEDPVPAEFQEGKVGELWFYLTPKGMNTVRQLENQIHQDF